MVKGFHCLNFAALSKLSITFDIKLLRLGDRYAGENANVNIMSVRKAEPVIPTVRGQL